MLARIVAQLCRKLLIGKTFWTSELTLYMHIGYGQRRTGNPNWALGVYRLKHDHVSVGVCAVCSRQMTSELAELECF